MFKVLEEIIMIIHYSSTSNKESRPSISLESSYYFRFKTYFANPKIIIPKMTIMIKIPFSIRVKKREEPSKIMLKMATRTTPIN